MASPSEILNSIAARRMIPLSLMLELTSRCNHSCGFCFKRRTPAGEELTTAEVTTLLDEVAELGTMSVQLTGGEPLLRKDLRQITAHARARNFKISIFTNGTLLDREVAGWIGALGVSSVQLSLHAADPGLHDALVGSPGSHEHVLRATRLLQEQGVVTTLSCTLVRDNLHQLDQLRALVEGLGGVVRFDPRTHAPCRAGDCGGWTGPDREVMQEVVSRPDMVQSFLEDPQSVPTTPGKPICAAGRTRLRIDERGTIFPCPALALPAGNIRDGGFAHVWRTSEVLIGLRAMTFDQTRCTDCELLPHCAPCIGRHHELTGSITDPAPQVCWEAALRRRLTRDP